jgi:PleD family two-component response regulator
MRPGLNRRILVNRADRRLYDAKNAGRNMVLA